MKTNNNVVKINTEIKNGTNVVGNITEINCNETNKVNKINKTVVKSFHVFTSNLINRVTATPVGV